MRSSLKKCDEVRCPRYEEIAMKLIQYQNYLAIMSETINSECCKGDYKFKPELATGLVDLSNTIYKDNLNGTITLSILDNNSLCMNPEFSQLIESVNETFNYCAKGNFDYKIQFKHIDGGTYEVSQMTPKNTSKNDLLKDNIQVDGFKYILNFYN